MCGISGVLSPKGDSIVMDLIQMTNIINYRGPDDEGYALFDKSSAKAECFIGNESPGNNSGEFISYFPDLHIDQAKDKKFDVGFGHRRLSILDLSQQGHQPMCDEAGQYWITYNGEIYNYSELKVELEFLGHSFRTHSDTEVILEAFKEWGVDCQQKFNGMWAFAIFNIQDQTLFLSRDRFGIKPLYYWFSTENSFYFASEIKQFTAVDGWVAQLNYPRAFDYLYYTLTDHTEETMFKGVFHLPPGSYIYSGIEEYKPGTSGKLITKRWYNPVFKEYSGSLEEAATEFRKHFISAIKLHLRSDVAIGSSLSGGVDSSAIVCAVNILLKSQNITELQKTFSSCSVDSRYDERIWMEEVISHTEVDAHFVYPNGEDVFNLTEKLIWHQDEPYQSQSAFLGYHVFEKAKEKGIKVILNGQGADEYLSGYTAYLGLRLRNLIRKLKFKSLFRELGDISFGKKAFASIKLLYHELPFPVSNYFSTFSKDHAIKKRLFSSRLFKCREEHPYNLIPYKHNSVFNIAHHQLLYQPLQKYLRWEDRNSMANSVEARVPFLDYRLIEFTTQLPLDFLDGLGQSKKILTNALQEILPEVIINRKDKKGFITPEQRWFLEDFKNEFIDLFDKNISYAKGIINEDEARNFLKQVQAGTIPFDYTYWRIISFCLWMKVFNVKS